MNSGPPVATHRHLFLMAGALWLVPSLGFAAAPKPPQEIPRDTAAVFLSAEGLAPASPQTYSVFGSGGRLVKVCRIGQAEAVPPGQYEFRVGFSSGWLTQAAELKAGDRYAVPTGLFTFKQIRPPDWPSTVPQELYAGNTYLATGYQGATARLLPGKYTVYYPDPVEAKPSESFATWYVAGPFAGASARNPLDAEYAPEKEAAHNPQTTYRVGRKTVAWSRLDGASEADLREAVPDSGVVYAFSALEAEGEKAVQLVLNSQSPTRAWLNGELLRGDQQPDGHFAHGRLTVMTRLRKGRNELFLKSVRSWMDSTVRAAVVYHKLYEVKIAADADRGPATAAEAADMSYIASRQAPCGLGGIVFCQVPDRADGACQLTSDEFFFPVRPRVGRICSLIPAAPNGQLRNLTPDFAAALYPALSYDGTRMLFSARKGPRDHWDIHEMNVDGSGLRQITRNIGDCLHPCYLPNGQILFSCGRNNIHDEYDKDIAKQLFICDPDGGNLTQISFNLSSESFPTVMSDGRILFTSWQHQGNHRGESGNFALFTCNPDGTVVMPFFGNQPGEGGSVQSFAQPTPDGHIVYVEVAGRGAYQMGALARLDPANPIRTLRQTSRGQMDYSNTYCGGRFTTPWPLPDGRMLCAFSPGRASIPQQGPSENPHLGIYWFDSATGREGHLIFDDPTAQDLWPRALTARPVPPVIPGLVQPGRRTGTLLCVNPYLSDRKPDAKSVTIGHLPPARPGEIKAVRVVEGFGNIDTNPKRHAGFVTTLGMAGHGTSNTASSFEQKRIIGYAPAEADGSFSVEVPADTTMHLQTLDENGMAIETQLTWIWVRPGERRFCVGCHESRETALPNLDCLAMHRPAPHFVAPPPEQCRTVDFRRDLMRIIDRKCASAECHGGGRPAGSLNLGGGFELVFHRAGRNQAYFNRAYESLLANTHGVSLMGRLVEPGTARHSPLIWRLYDKQLGLSDPHVNYHWPEKPTPHKPFLTDAERKLFVEWVDIGAQWDNIPGDDEFPGYDADKSREMAQRFLAEASKPISDPRLAFETRCCECHDQLRTYGAAGRLRTEADWRELSARMDKKRPGWIHSSELPPITQHLLENCLPRTNK